MRLRNALALLVLSTACTATSPDVPTTRAPQTMRESFRPPGYVRGNKDARAKRVIIFVHGIFGDGITTWTNTGTQPHAYFPRLIADDATFDGVDVWVHDFDTPKLRATYTIDELADNLRKHLNNDNVISNHDELIIVSHSMGGLIARAYLLKYHRETPPEKVRMLYFYSTPTTGSDVASLARLISNNPTLTDMRKMTTDDQGVLGLWEAQWSSSRYAQQTLSYCAYEVLATRGIHVVQRESARALCNTRPDPIARDHIQMVKPANNENDETYIAFREAYRDTFERNDTSVLSPPVWNLSSRDKALLRVRNVSQTPHCGDDCWSDEVVVAPGDYVTFSVSCRNRSAVTAADVRVRLEVPPYPLGALPLRATVTARRGPPAFGSVSLTAIAPVMLRPTGAWRYDAQTERYRDLPYGQAAQRLTTKDGLRLGDIGTNDAEEVVVQFRAEPVVLAGTEAGTAIKLMKNLVRKAQHADLTDEELESVHIPTGRIDTGEIGTDMRWMPELTDLHADSTPVLVLRHYNNTDQIQRQLRATVHTDTEPADHAIVTAIVRDASGDASEGSATLRLRAGTTHRPVLTGAFHMRKGNPTNAHELNELLPLATIERPREIELGDLPPQTGVAIILEYAMLPLALHADLRQPAEEDTATLNGNAAGPPLLQVSNTPHTRSWREHINGLRAGENLSAMFFFHNTSRAIARAVILQLRIAPTRDGFRADGTMTSRNAPPVTGTSRIRFLTAVPRARLYYDDALTYRYDANTGRYLDASSVLADGLLLGDLNPGESGWVVINFRSSTLASDTSGCPARILAVGTPTDVAITIDNPSAVALRDVRLQLATLRQGEEFHITSTATAGAVTLFTRRERVLTPHPIELRYRHAYVHDAFVRKPFDATDAMGAGVELGDIAPGEQRFLRIRYDVRPVR